MNWALQVMKLAEKYLFFFLGGAEIFFSILLMSDSA